MTLAKPIKPLNDIELTNKVKKVLLKSVLIKMYQLQILFRIRRDRNKTNDKSLTFSYVPLTTYRVDYKYFCKNRK